MKVNGNYLLKKFPGKGGWTYAEIPEIKPDKKNIFGWVQVKGHIDTYELKQYKLMPMGNGKLFLPVRAEIRKKIKKEAGDWVEVILEKDSSKYQVPGEIIECLEQESSEILQKFYSIPVGKQKAYIDWIYSAKTVNSRVRRIVEMMDSLNEGTSI